MTEVRQRSVALILARELAVNLATPMWVWDELGTLVYHNAHAVTLVGGTSHDLGVESLADVTQFQAHDLDGNPVAVDDVPSAIALRERRPAHRELRITGLDGKKRNIAVTAFPLFVRTNEFVGALAIFWELPDGESG
jgi:PAS domain-containing protein